MGCLIQKMHGRVQPVSGRLQSGHRHPLLLRNAVACANRCKGACRLDVNAVSADSRWWQEPPPPRIDASLLPLCAQGTR